MSSRISQRIRRRRNQCRWANAFHDPALGAESGAVLGAPAGGDRLHAEIPDQAAVLVVVVAVVAQHHVRAAPGPASLAAHRRYRLKQWDQLLSELIEAGKVRPWIDRRYRFADIPVAIAYLEQGHARAKVVVGVA